LNRPWHCIERIAEQTRNAPAEKVVESDTLAAALERLADEVRTLHSVLDEIREDLSWVTRNGLPIQPIEHVIVKRMSKDPLADDWDDQLETIHLQSPPSKSHLDADAIQKLADGLTAAFEGIAQGHLEIVLTALDGVRAETLAVIGKQPGRTTLPPEVPQTTPPSTDAAGAAKPQTDRPPAGSLF